MGLAAAGPEQRAFRDTGSVPYPRMRGKLLQLFLQGLYRVLTDFNQVSTGPVQIDNHYHHSCQG